MAPDVPSGSMPDAMRILPYRPGACGGPFPGERGTPCVMAVRFWERKRSLRCARERPHKNAVLPYPGGLGPWPTAPSGDRLQGR
jgi:hypothetical protein